MLCQRANHEEMIPTTEEGLHKSEGILGWGLHAIWKSDTGLSILTICNHLQTPT